MNTGFRTLIATGAFDATAALHRVVHLLGFDAETAVGGDDAVRKLAAGGYDLVLVAHHTPDMDGADLLRWMNETLEPRPVVMIVTDDSRLETVRLFHRLRSDGFMSEPVAQHDLASMILTLRRGEGGAHAAQ